MEAFTLTKDDIESFEIVNKEATVHDLTMENNSNFFLKTNAKDILVHNSGKTFGLSCFNVIAARDHNHRILYTRQTMSSTDNSITEALNKRLELLGVDNDFEYANKNYIVKNSIGKISITGQRTSSGSQTAKLKSLEGYSIFETEEGEELESFEEWEKTKRSMRATDVQCLSIIAFNPPTREHFIYTEFFEDAEVQEGFNGINNNVLYIHTTYMDNIDNIAEHNLRDYEKLRLAYEEYEALSNKERELASPKLKKQHRKYKNIVLGGFKDKEEGVIFEDWEIGEFPTNQPFCYGMDFGFDDPDVLVKLAVDDSQKKIYIHETLNMNGLGTDTLATILLDRVGYNGLIIADSAHKRLINDLQNKGLNIKKCKKGGGSVLRNIKTLQGYTLIVTESSKGVMKSFRNYVWHDKRSGVPKNDHKHFPDAIGYGAMELIMY